jgi:DNA ligase (NAD+)
MITVPKNCPSCNSTLERVNDQLFCRNINCSAKNSKVVEKYANKVKIKGLGPKAIEKLELDNISDIYNLTEEFLTEIIGANGKKIYAEIQNKKVIPLSVFLGSCSIPLIGITTAEKITTSIEDITKESLISDGMGNKAADNLINWLANNNIPSALTLKPNIQSNPSEISLIVCISGKIPGYTKASLTLYLAEHNIVVMNTVNKEIDYLISQSKTSAKAQKAIKLNKTIVTIDELKEILNESTT